MKILDAPKTRFVFYLFLFVVINLLQSNFTGLFEDEAYYWIWSKDLDWGYFDHPPLVALWAAVGSSMFSGELGIRFVSALSFSGLIWVLWQCVDVPNKWEKMDLFFGLLFSLAFLQIFGFIVTPDTPLLFFFALFLLSYKNFLKKQSVVTGLFLGLTMAGMLYSKYHGILIIGFVCLSNLSLFKSSYFWFASLFGAILFVPHLYWQYENGFPSFVYHLQDRSKKPYHITNTLTHLVNVIAVVGLTFPFVYKAFFRSPARTAFERGLKWIVYGFFFFFLVSTMNSQPQAQWLIATLPPLLLISFTYFREHSSKWLNRLIWIQASILLVGRLFFAFPSISPLPLETHLAQQWVPELKEATKSQPLVFVNSYRNASVYEFYTGIKSHSYSILRGRKSQYNLKDFEHRMQGENVFAVSKFMEGSPELMRKTTTPFFGKPIDNYTTFEKVHCIILKDSHLFVPGENKITFDIINNYPKKITFEQTEFVGVFLGKKNKIIKKINLVSGDINDLEEGGKRTVTASFNLNEVPVEAIEFRIGLDFYGMQEGYQGNKISVIRED